MLAEYEQMAEDLLEVQRRSESELDCLCPLPDHRDSNASFRFNIETGLWICHGCHKTGNARTLYRTLTGQELDGPRGAVLLDLAEADIEDWELHRNKATKVMRVQETQKSSSRAVGRKVTVRSRSETEVLTNQDHQNTLLWERSDTSQHKTAPESPLPTSPKSFSSLLEEDKSFEKKSSTEVREELEVHTRAHAREEEEETEEGFYVPHVEDRRSRYDYVKNFGVLVSTSGADSYVDEKILSRYKNDDTYWSQARGFDPDWVDVFELGYDPIADQHTLPIRDIDGRLLGVNRRDRGTGSSRYLLPSKFQRKRHLYGSWLVGKYVVDYPHTAVITEGGPDAIAVWHTGYQGLATYGSSINPSQIRLLHRLGIREVIVAYDDDKPGRKGTEQATEAIRASGMFVGAMVWPAVHRGLDPAKLFQKDPEYLRRALDRTELM